MPDSETDPGVRNECVGRVLRTAVRVENSEGKGHNRTRRASDSILAYRAIYLGHAVVDANAESGTATNQLVRALVHSPNRRIDQNLVRRTENRTITHHRDSSRRNSRSIQLSDSGNSEVILDVEAITAASLPTIGEMNVSDSKIDFGPKFVSIKRTIYTEEVIKGRLLGLELKSSKKKNSLRCSVIVFVCWAVVVACGMAHHFIKYAVVQPRQSRMDLNINEWWYLRRTDWQARSPRETTFLTLPLRYVIIGHTGTEACEDKHSCIDKVLTMQIHDQFSMSWDDIGPNFLVTPEGLIFEGRGVNVQGAMVRYYNSRSITIKFLGDYRVKKPIPQQFHHLNDLLTELVAEGVLRMDYQVSGHCQMDPSVSSPGRNIIEELSHLSHWWPNNLEGCFAD